MTFSAAISRAFCVAAFLAGFVFLALMQYCTWLETAQAGRQYPDPLLPCAIAALMTIAVVTVTVMIPIGIGAWWRWWRQRRLRRIVSAARAVARAAQALPSHARALPMVVPAHPDAPARVIWRPDDDIFDVADIAPVCRMAFDHDAAIVVVKMKPAAEQAARILIRDFWPRLCAEEGADKPCPIVLPIATGGIITSRRPYLMHDDGPPPLVVPAKTVRR